MIINRIAEMRQGWGQGWGAITGRSSSGPSPRALDRRGSGFPLLLGFAGPVALVIGAVLLAGALGW